MLSMKHFQAHVTPEMLKLINATVSAIESSIPDNEDSQENHEHAVALLSEALEALLNGNSVTINTIRTQISLLLKRQMLP